METIAEFIRELETGSQSSNVNNFYYGDERASICRKNLRLYLESMMGARTLLIGEAPGYRGCVLSGIPFTSEYIMMRGIKNHNLFGAKRGYKASSGLKKFKKEATATIVWSTLDGYEQLPLMWNAFPWHPHDSGNIESNREPTVAEIEEGSKFIQALIRIYPIREVVAVGKKAEKALSRIGSDIQKSDLTLDQVRHPSNGGKNDFVAGIEKIYRVRLSLKKRG